MYMFERLHIHMYIHLDRVYRLCAREFRIYGFAVERNQVVLIHSKQACAHVRMAELEF